MFDSRLCVTLELYCLVRRLAKLIALDRPWSIITLLLVLQSVWSSDLKNNVQAFLSATLKSQEKPRLFHLYKQSSAEAERERKLYLEQLKKLQSQVTRKEEQFAQYQKRFSKIQVIICKLTIFKL